ncbi:MAG: hypothetical protein ABI658_12190 [Acidimicrobiales bacterium]
MIRAWARGSVLMLMPAGLVIVFVLGSISIEYAAVSMRQRALYNAADGAANDAATYAIDRVTLRATGEVVLDPTLVEEAVGVSLRSQGVVLVGPPLIEVLDDGKTIHLELVQHVPFVIAGALPGTDGTIVRANVRVTTVDTG